jgi:ATP-dependent Lon protease
VRFYTREAGVRDLEPEIGSGWRGDAGVDPGRHDRGALPRPGLGLEPEFYQKHNVHLHIPEGATPKDGPSAGIGMCAALVSALTKIPVRSGVAMAGQITLRGELLPIGGLKEKLLAAHRGGIKTVLIPDENEKDLVEIPENIKSNLDIEP